MQAVSDLIEDDNPKQMWEFCADANLSVSPASISPSGSGSPERRLNVSARGTLPPRRVMRLPLAGMPAVRIAGGKATAMSYAQAASEGYGGAGAGAGAGTSAG